VTRAAPEKLIGRLINADSISERTTLEARCLNQQLSEKRAATVRDYLVQQGIGINAVSARGFGKTMPVASNDTAAGRQQNRRVEMIVAGDVIGIPISPLGSTRP